jgi:hypothetical protein
MLNIIKSMRKKIANKCDSEFPKKVDISGSIDIIPLMNNRCQYNAVHAVKAGKAVAVIECVMVESDRVISHYISQLGDGRYVDFTLGWSWSGSDYRFIRIVPDSEYADINESLGNLKERVADMARPTWIKPFIANWRLS